MVSGMVSIPRILWMRVGFSPVVNNSIKTALSVILLRTAAVRNSEMYSSTEPFWERVQSLAMAEPMELMGGENLFKVFDELVECSEGDWLLSHSLLKVVGGPGLSNSFLHVGEGKDDPFVIVVVDLLVNKDVGPDRIQPAQGCIVVSIVLSRSTNL